jgi:hypothetical protein
MMNSMDKEEIVKKLADNMRTYSAHHSVTLTSEDLNSYRNFIDDMLSNYTDDRHLIDNERGPDGQVETKA